MAKDFGSDRMVDKYSLPNAEVKSLVEEMNASGRYKQVEMTTSGGVFAIEKGKAKHKIEEVEAGRHMARAGYRVILKDETGSVQTKEGYIYSFTFEQKTPKKGGASFKKAIEHASDKRAEVAVVYDKHSNYHRQEVEDGIIEYEKHKSYRFKRIIVISKAGNVYEHSHNDK